MTMMRSTNLNYSRQCLAEVDRGSGSCGSQSYNASGRGFLTSSATCSAFLSNISVRRQCTTSNLHELSLIIQSCLSSYPRVANLPGKSTHRQTRPPSRYRHRELELSVASLPVPPCHLLPPTSAINLSTLSPYCHLHWPAQRSDTRAD